MFETIQNEVCEMTGECPIRKVGDKNSVNGQTMVVKENGVVCVEASDRLYNMLLPRMM